MDRTRYLDLLDSEGTRLSNAAAQDLDAVVPWCPGWTVGDVVRHTAAVYEHKIRCVQLAGECPPPWPEDSPAAGQPLSWFVDAKSRLLDVLTRADPAAPSWTWWPQEQTVSFWLRRMAQETAIHRADAESAFGDVAAVDTELALDGVDEVLERMLSGDWSDEPQLGPSNTIDVIAAGRSWQVAMSPEQVDVGDVVHEAPTQVTGSPSDVLLWLWGRAPGSAVRVLGDPAVARQLRERLSLATR